jgi:hypothetical protein
MTMRYRVVGIQNDSPTQATFTVTADSIEDARRQAEAAGIRILDLSLMDGMSAGERWFVGATASVLLLDSVIALFVVATVLGGGERTPWSGHTPWQALSPVVFVMATTLLLAQGAYAGSRLLRRLDLAWAGLNGLATLPVVVLVVAGLVGAVVRREAALPWGVLLPVPALRLGAYVFLGWALMLSESTRAFLDAQAQKRVQLVTVGSVALLVLVVLALLAMATIPFTLG